MFIYQGFHVDIYVIKYILANTLASDKLIAILFVSFILSIFFKNSIELMQNFKPNYKNSIFILTLALVSILEMHQVSEFLYFNF